MHDQYHQQKQETQHKQRRVSVRDDDGHLLGGVLRPASHDAPTAAGDVANINGCVGRATTTDEGA
jgi:hypothetical protein